MKELQPNAYKIERYTPDKESEWNSFVDSSRNGTFLHKRGYMDYHAHRFADHSLMFYCRTELAAILPAHIKDDSFCSHNGLTYGGLLLPDSTTTAEVLELFGVMLKYLNTNTATTRIIYKPTPHIYHRYPTYTTATPAKRTCTHCSATEPCSASARYRRQFPSRSRFP